MPIPNVDRRPRKFAGSADTAVKLRGQLQQSGVNSRFNVEADSLNAAVLAPGVAEGGATMELFVRDVVREITQKAGQKCTAVRRILVPVEQAAHIEQVLVGKLQKKDREDGITSWKGLPGIR